MARTIYLAANQMARTIDLAANQMAAIWEPNQVSTSKTWHCFCLLKFGSLLVLVLSLIAIMQ